MQRNEANELKSQQKFVPLQSEVYNLYIMATAIATIPVLTDEVAERFEAEAQATYERCLNRTEAEKRELAERNRRGMEMVRKMLAKSKKTTRNKPHWKN